MSPVTVSEVLICMRVDHVIVLEPVEERTTFDLVVSRVPVRSIPDATT